MFFLRECAQYLAEIFLAAVALEFGLGKNSF